MITTLKKTIFKLLPNISLGILPLKLSCWKIYKKKAFTVANMFDKVKKIALSFLNNKTVKNKNAAFEDSAFIKDFSATCKADDHKNSFSSNNKQLQVY
jgi:hypothetical protein